MFQRITRTSLPTLLAVAMVAMVSSDSHALITHDDTVPANKPADGVVGSYRGNASCVVVRPNWILTTRHQAANGPNQVGATVRINGVPYTMVEVIDEPNSVDLRVARIETAGGERANLQDYANYNSSLLNDAIGTEVVIGGFGWSRGADVMDGPLLVGYEFFADGNATQEWGTNTIDFYAMAAPGGFANTELFGTDFDGPGALGSTMHEAQGIFIDSGGGAFVEDNGEWLVVGLMHAVSLQTPLPMNPADGETRFLPLQDQTFFVRVSQHAAFLDANLPAWDPVPPTATLWESIAPTGMVDVAETVPTSGDFSETRGLDELEIAFDEPIFPDSFEPDNIVIEGRDLDDNPVDLTGITVSTSLSMGNTVGTITLSSPLPNLARYRVTLSEVTDEIGNFASSGVVRTFATLPGDLSDDGRVDSADFALLSDVYGAAVDTMDRDSVFADVDNDGDVVLNDFAIANANWLVVLNGILLP